MSVLKFTRASDNKDLGILTWFPVHGTSMYGNNTLVAGDNKGVAADMFEKAVTGLSTVADGFVAGFSQSNVGDTSPNTLGAWCEDGSNVQCTFDFSLCSGVAENCHGRGPNFTLTDRGATSAYTIGSLQYEAARSLYDNWQSQTTPINGGTVKAFHTFQNMSFYQFTLPNGTHVQACPAALGYGFAGGTSDWPGSFDFKQGNNPSSHGTHSNPHRPVVTPAKSMPRHKTNPPRRRRNGLPLCLGTRHRRHPSLTCRTIIHDHLPRRSNNHVRPTLESSPSLSCKIHLNDRLFPPSRRPRRPRKLIHTLHRHTGRIRHPALRRR